jgi:hypothetical protein
MDFNARWTLAEGRIEGGMRMKSMLLIYSDEQSWSDADHCYGESTELAHELKSKGQFLATAPLQPTSTATSVRV